MITLEKYLEGIESIYVEQPEYQLGHDGSDGYCDCIGMVKGAIRRGGGNASGLSGTNYAARNTIEKLRKISSAEGLEVGDVVLKGRQPGESGYDLPDKYKSGSDLTDYYHIGTVTQINPLVITHMTAPTAKKDSLLGKWNYAGWVPEIKRDSPSTSPEPDPPEPAEDTAIVTSENGRPVNMRTSPSRGAALIERVPVGETVKVITKGEDWCRIKWKWYEGWMMTEFLLFQDEDDDAEVYSIFIDHLTREQAEALHAEWPDSTIAVG